MGRAQLPAACISSCTQYTAPYCSCACESLQAALHGKPPVSLTAAAYGACRILHAWALRQNSSAHVIQEGPSLRLCQPLCSWGSFKHQKLTLTAVVHEKAFKHSGCACTPETESHCGCACGSLMPRSSSMSCTAPGMSSLMTIAYAPGTYLAA